ncbi:hypothetical protein [Nitrosomonas sp.]|uniref:hypothetical protein n=1 Tax=Nitrosomonas sp. TaxID=42353 RepID=UPI0033065D66
MRKLMLEAALAQKQPPDGLSFKHSLFLMRRKLPPAAPSSPEQFQKWWQKLLEATASGTLTSPRGRSNPRLVKRRTKQYLPRKGGELLNLRHDWSPVVVK